MGKRADKMKSDTLRAQVRQMIGAGYSVARIAKETGKSLAHVKRIAGQEIAAATKLAGEE